MDGVFKVLPYLVSVHDQDGKYLRVNKAVIDLFGFDPTLATREEIARRVKAHFPDGTPLIPENMPSSRALSGETVKDVEYLITNERGEEHVLLFSAVPLKQGGQVYGAVFSQLDITERKRAEEALRESEERFRSLVEQAVDGIFMADAQGRYIDVNTAGARMLGYTREEVCRLSVTDVISPADIARMPAQMSALASGSVTTNEWQFCRKDGSTFIGEVVGRQLPDGRLLGILRDITERKRAEEALRSAHTELERRAFELNAVNRELEAFAYTVSHDLKAPLRSIEGFTRAIAEDYGDKLDEPGKDYVRRVTTACQRMTQLIDAMLSMSRLTGGELHEKTVDLGALAQGIAHNLKHNEPQRNVEFSLLPKASVKGDATMLQIALQNLLENAWKFTGRHPKAQIEFGVADMDGNTVYFVRDDGAGFDMQFADKLFQPFKRLHTDAEFPGLGIGLAIAYRIILRHGGRMWTKAQVEKGATFYFTLSES